MAELKPCPFCGGGALINQFCNGWDSYSFRVSCRRAYECGATQLWFDTEAEAIEAWNRRSDSNGQT